MKTIFLMLFITIAGCNRTDRHIVQDEYIAYLKSASEQIKGNKMQFISDSLGAFEMLNRYLDDKIANKHYGDVYINSAIRSLDSAISNAGDSIQCKIRRTYGLMLADYLTNRYGYDFDASFPIQYNYGKILSATYENGSYKRIIQNSATTIFLNSLYFKQRNRTDEIYNQYFGRMKYIGYIEMRFQYPTIYN